VTKNALQLSIAALAVAALLGAGSAVAVMPKPPAKGVGAGAPAVAVPLRANLSATQVPSLQVASTATGRFLGALIRSGFGAKGQRLPNLSWGLFWVISVQNTTGPVTSVEIRSGAVGAAASSVFLTLCGPCNVSASAVGGGPNFLTGKLSTLTQQQVTALRTADLYVNVTTAANPAGELRGPITRHSPVTSGAPPNNRVPNPIKPGPPNKVTGP
jgi:hypothetical protein